MLSTDRTGCHDDLAAAAAAGPAVDPAPAAAAAGRARAAAGRTLQDGQRLSGDQVGAEGGDAAGAAAGRLKRHVIAWVMTDVYHVAVYAFSIDNF